MSKLVAADTLLITFPSALAEDEKQLALATVTAQELVELYEDNDILALYARIDELDEPLLDILAYDFKVDWWDENFTLTEKRETFKQIWNVKRTLGTPLSSYLAFSAIFQNAKIQEWWQYGGNPHYFKIHIELGGVLTDYCWATASSSSSTPSGTVSPAWCIREATAATACWWLRSKTKHKKPARKSRFSFCAV